MTGGIFLLILSTNAWLLIAKRIKAVYFCCVNIKKMHMKQSTINKYRDEIRRYVVNTYRLHKSELQASDKAIWRTFIKPIFGIQYTTFLKYLKSSNSVPIEKTE